jgi:hypothetical protein
VRGVLHAIALVCAASLSAQRPDQPSGALPSGGTGLIAGQVTDPGTGKPVPEALVTLRVGVVTGPESPRVLADAQGRFVFVNVPAGRYGVSAMKMGYSGCSSGEVTIADGQVLTDVVARCQKWAVISGTVTDEAGQPVVGVRVDAYRRTIAFGEVRLSPWTAFSRFATTDDRGMFRLPELPPGEYTAGVTTTLTTFPAGVMPATQVTGELRSQAFYALGDLNGPLGDPRNQQVGDSVLLTGSRGVFPPTPAGADVGTAYRTTFSPGTALPGEATMVPLTSGEERSDLDIALRPVRAARISGRVLGPEGPMPHTVVRLLAAGRWRIALVAFEGATATALTDEAGRFTFLGVPDGEFVASMRTGEPQIGFLSADEPVTVGGSEITDVTLTARPSPRVSGRFELRSGKPPGNTTLNVGLDPIDLGSFGGVLLPQGPELRFSTFVQRGAYRLNPRAPAGLSCSAIMREGRDITDEVLLVGADNIELTVVCGEPATRLGGTVRKTDGAGDADALIIAFPTERAHRSGTTVRPRRLQQATADTSGGFTLNNLPAGDYFVAAIPIARSELWRDPKFLDQLTRSATRITLTQGESRTIDLRMVQVR